MSGLKEKFEKEIKAKIKKDLKLPSIMAVPTLQKIVINVGLGEALKDKEVIDIVVSDLYAITGQKPVLCRARDAISNFKIRKGDVIGAKVTLRGKKMWDFTAKMIDLVFPRVKDFRGLDTRAFDGSGNYTVGLEEQTIFFEIDPNKVTKLRGMEITFVTSAKDDETGLVLLKELGVPFREVK